MPRHLELVTNQRRCPARAGKGSRLQGTQVSRHPPRGSDTFHHTQMDRGVDGWINEWLEAQMDGWGMEGWVDLILGLR